MIRLRDLPIGRKLVIVALASSALALAVSSAIVLAVTYGSMRRNILVEMETQTAIVADNAASSVAFETSARPRETLQLAAADGLGGQGVPLHDDGGAFALVRLSLGGGSVSHSTAARHRHRHVRRTAS